MTPRNDLFLNIGIGFAIGAFFALVAGGPEMWMGVQPASFLAFIR